MIGNAAVHETHMQAADVLPDYFADRAEHWDFDSVDYMKFHGHATQVFMNLELAFLFHKEGTVDDEYFASRMRLLRRALQIPGFRRWWNVWAEDFYDARFLEYADALIKDDVPQKATMGA